jgi:hypothetical protein
LLVSKVESRRLRAVLEQYRCGSVLEDRVGEGIAPLPLLADLDVQVIGDVLRFPVAARQVILILECAVRRDVLAADLHALLRDQRPAEPLAGVVEESREGGFGRSFVRGSMIGVGLERGVVDGNRGVRRLDRIAHGRQLLST